jgi:LPS-assembly lipoprotein
MTRRAALQSLGRGTLLGLSALALGGCGFKLRGAQSYDFQTLAIAGTGSALADELRRSLGKNVQLLPPGAPLKTAQVILDIVREQRERVVVGISSTGQVRELQLRIRLVFRVGTPQGDELVPQTELLQRRDISFNETAVLAKEAEEALLYRDMQTDLVQQLLRRLAAVRL